MFNEVELAFFFKQLHYLIKSGISLYPAIELIYIDVGNKALKTPLKIILESLKEGEDFSTILNEKIGVTLFLTNMIKVGEKDGSLASALNKAGFYLESKIELKRKVTTALMYPIILAVLGLIILVWLLFGMLPQFKTIFADANILLPLPTRILFRISDIVVAYWWNVPLIILITGLLVFFLFKKDLQQFFSQFKFKIPIYGTFSYYLTLMNFLSNLGSLHNSGISLIKSLNLTIETTDNNYFKGLLHRVQHKLVEGEKLSAALFETKFFPNIVIKLVMIGEETAEVDKMLMQLTEYLNQELEIELKRFIALIGPISLMFIGVFVAFIAISILLPLFMMAGVVHNGR